MVRKGVVVWILGSLTFLVGLHTLDGFLWMTGNLVDPMILAIYPSNELFNILNPSAYFICSLVVLFFLWGGTVVVALRNPIETFLGKVLEDGRKESQGDVELLEAKTGILEMMSETLTNNSQLLSGLRDVVFNVRSEVLRLDPLNEHVEAMRSDVEQLKRTIKKLEREIKRQKLCPACGREISEKFRLCPYCGENLLKPSMSSERIMVATKSLPSCKR